MMFPLIKTLRPKQWIKNLFVAVPLMFGQKLTDPTSLLITAGAVGLFCLVSGSVYVLNDLVDIEKDRAHPKKCKRPLPSGQLSETLARNFVIGAVPVALALGYFLEPLYAAILAGYFVNNLAYSFKVKHVPYLDVLSIALGFILRVLAGAFALHVEPSIWLLSCTGLLAMFLGFGKRAHELSAGAEQAKKQRAVLARYNAKLVTAFLYLLGVASVGVYLAYTMSGHVAQMFTPDAAAKLPFTTVLPLVAIPRFIQLAVTRPDAESPTEEMLRDPIFMGTFVLWLVSLAAILYGWV